VNLRDCPVDAHVFEVELVRQNFENAFANAIDHSAVKVLEDAVPFPKVRRKVVPGYTGPRSPDHRLEKQPVVGCGPARVVRFPGT